VVVVAVGVAVAAVGIVRVWGDRGEWWWGEEMVVLDRMWGVVGRVVGACAVMVGGVVMVGWVVVGGTKDALVRIIPSFVTTA
jgi:hypothetical protein